MKFNFLSRELVSILIGFILNIVFGFFVGIFEVRVFFRSN